MTVHLKPDGSHVCPDCNNACVCKMYGGFCECPCYVDNPLERAVEIAKACGNVTVVCPNAQVIGDVAEAILKLPPPPSGRETEFVRTHPECVEFVYHRDDGRRFIYFVAEPGSGACNCSGRRIFIDASQAM